MKIIFMGTPDFAVPCLEKLIEKNHEIVAVYTQPDKPVGRKQVLTQSHVKKCAIENNLSVYQPITLKNEDEIDIIKSFNADVIVVVAYGKILPLDILNASKYGAINVHASLLPKYRGAAPIQWSILNGDEITGVTIQKMNEGIDTGDILYAEKTDIDPDETSAELFERLSQIGADALVKVIDNIDYYIKNAVKQSEDCSSYASKITKDLSPIDWTKSALEIHNQVRGLQTWPCALTGINGKSVKIHKTRLSNKVSNESGIIVDNNDVLTVCCGDLKCIDILELQPYGKKRMSTKAFLAGNKIDVGTIIGG